VVSPKSAQGNLDSARIADLLPAAAVATTGVRFVATDTLGLTTTREGVWTLVFAEDHARENRR
jgi:hypothetical protein